MSRPCTSRIIFPSLIISLLAFLLIGCGGGDDEGEVMAEPSGPDIRAGRVCTDERQQAAAHTRGQGVPALWNGEPFVVDVSAALPDAQGLLAAVAEEAELVRFVLGYHIFVAGEVLELDIVHWWDLEQLPPDPHVEVEQPPCATGTSCREERLLPPEQHIEIRCCVGSGAGPGTLGVAYAWWRVILLEDAPHQVIIHELYHVLGFVHPDEQGVQMSSSLQLNHLAYDPREVTRSTQEDWANLACIYD